MNTRNFPLLSLLPVALAAFGTVNSVAADDVSFSRDVLPILADRCFHCHGPDSLRREADLRLDERESALADRGGYAVVVPTSPESSELLERVTTDDPDLLMPPADSHRKPLSDQEIDTLRRWIAGGAAWGMHWAFEKPLRPQLDGSDRHPIDLLIRRRLEREGLTPAPEADRRTLIRRVTLDLIGLPPTRDEVEAFIADDSPQAYEKLVDRLLQSPQYGERMAWPWLDAARYADTGGFQGDPERSMWPWRDWVIDALNHNMPFDQFTIEQIAGDLLADATPEQRLATGFNRNHMHNSEGGRIAEETRVENVFDRAETTGTVWLGLTLQCARCHDHKFDPTSNDDYFAFFDFFNQTTEEGRTDRSVAVPPSMDYLSLPSRARLEELKARADALKAKLLEPSPGADAAQAAWEAQWNDTSSDTQQPSDADAEIATILGKSADKRDDADRARLREYFRSMHSKEHAQIAAPLQAARAELDRLKQKSPPVKVMVMDTNSKPRETFVLVKGIYNDATDRKITADVPGMLPPLPEKQDDRAYTRLDLARWLVSSDNPLTARVIVNRYWQLFFARGMVSTPDDFGLQGTQPTHPDLLDWLAVEFVESGWDVKQMHRLIVTSATYRQSARGTPTSFERDPENLLLSRAPRYRMPSWMLRDQALAVSGLLQPTIGGPPVKPYQPEGIWAEATFGQIRYEPDAGEKLYRRSLYTFWRRIVGPTMFFDAAKRQTCEVKTSLTNTPLHALTTLNDITYVEAARVLAQRMMQQHDAPRDRIVYAFDALTSRPPQADELRLLERRLESYVQQFRGATDEAAKLLSVGDSPRDPSLDAAEHAAYTTLCNTLMNLDEVLAKP